MSWIRNYDGSIDDTALAFIIMWSFILLVFIGMIFNTKDNTQTTDYQLQPACGEYWCK